MTHHDLSSAASQALMDLPNSTTETPEILDTGSDSWTPADATPAAVDLEAAGYGYRNVNGSFQWTVPFRPITETKSPVSSPTPEEPCS